MCRIMRGQGPALSESVSTRYLLPFFFVVFTAPTQFCLHLDISEKPRKRQREKTFFYYNILLKRKCRLAELLDLNVVFISSWSLYICLSREVQELVKVLVAIEKT